MRPSFRRFTQPIGAENPITVQILGICSALAVTTSLTTALTMCVALMFVLSLASTLISSIRRHVPTSVRLIVQITIIASLVIIADQFLRAHLFEVSQRLSIFVGLIVTNCIVLARTEGFAMHNRVWPSFLDAFGNGLGYSLILILVSTVRELFGTGTLLGFVILPTIENGGWFQPLNLMLLAPSAFFIIGFLIWIIRSWHPEQLEAPQYSVRSDVEGEWQ
ncbi:MAG: Na+-transporting NADH:ubiquinone oxidoreductase subunit D [Hyphomicrobiaceae bacterium]|jgi:Na+-transporting NADH:ubiquinone oxidoreductase subunit D